MGTLWFCLAAIVITGYVLLDGFDLGAGIVQLFVARAERETGQVLNSIGPVWDGNEVWLIAAGGTLFFAFPALYASAFSGFYLSLMIVLWLLILRGISIEFRPHVDSPLWRPLWGTVFGLASAALALLFGVALGNVVRGVPLDQSGYFFLPLWTNLSPSGEVGIIDWYTLLVGAASLFALAEHGSLWVVLKTEGSLQERTRSFGARCWAGVRRDHSADVGRELFDPAKPDQAVSEPPLGSNISSDGRRGHDRDARAQFPSAGSAGVFGVRFTSGQGC